MPQNYDYSDGAPNMFQQPQPQKGQGSAAPAPVPAAGGPNVQPQVASAAPGVQPQAASTAPGVTPFSEPQTAPEVIVPKPVYRSGADESAGRPASASPQPAGMEPGAGATGLAANGPAASRQAAFAEQSAPAGSPAAEATFAPQAATAGQQPREAASTGRFQSVDAAPAQPAGYQQQPVYVAAPPKKGRGWIVAIVVTVCLCALIAFCVKSCTDLFGAGVSGSDASISGDAIAVIELDGTIQYDGSACSPEGLKALLDEAEESDQVKAIVLRVNSGGGTATAGEEMAQYVRDFPKPVVVSSASINASAAYEISSQADYLYVAKSTEIGAIGTAMQFTDLSGLLDMLGIDMDTITSADSKDSSYGYRPLTDEERAYYQHMVDQINETFIENVAEGRKMPPEQVRSLATGLSFTGIDAVENGLADEIGTREDALDKAAELAGITDYTPFDLQFSDYDIADLYDLLGSQSANDQSGALAL